MKLTSTLVIVGGEDGGRVFGGMGRTLWALLLSRFIVQKLRGRWRSSARRPLE